MDLSNLGFNVNMMKKKWKTSTVYEFSFLGLMLNKNLSNLGSKKKKTEKKNQKKYTPKCPYQILMLNIYGF